MRLQDCVCGLTVVVAITLGSVCAGAASQEQAPRTVLTIHWGSESAPSAERQDAAIRNFLRTQPDLRVNYFAEYLETEEFPAETASSALRDYIRRKFEGRHIDVVIAVASASAQFALRYRDELFPGVPIVFAATAPPQTIVDRTAGGITGVLNDTPFSETLELALNLHPSAKRVFVVANAPSVEGYDERVRSALSGFSDRVELTYIKERTVPSLLAAVKAVPPQSLIFYTRYTPDEPAPNVFPESVARLIADVAHVPVYGVSEAYLGNGLVGGVMRTSEALGTGLGEMAVQILEGTPPESIPIAAVPTAPVFDWRQLRRWGIEPAQLPATSRVLFRTRTVWEMYGWYVVAAITVVTLQLALITGLVTQRARRRRAEDVVCAREASLRTSYDRIQQLAGRLINAQEAARASLAQDLHDDICQRLAMVSTTIDRLKSSSGDLEDDGTQHAFTVLRSDTRKTFEAVRQLSYDLHPATLRLLGLAPALENHCAEMATRHDVEVTFTTQGDVQHIPSDIAICFFRIAQESLRNGVVHGAARRLAVSLDRCGDELEMTVADDGRGFNLEAVGHHAGGVGVVSMGERAHAIGGTLHISTGVQHGTTIRIRVPLKAPRRVGTLGVRASVIAVAALCCLETAVFAQTPPQAPRTVVAIHGGPEFFPGSEPTDKAIRNVLLSSSGMTVNYFAEYLENEEFGAELASSALRSYIQRKFEGRRIDVFIANTVVALEFTIRLRDELYPGVPIVFIATILPDAVVRGTAKGITGVLRGVALKETLELALTVHPSIKQVFVIAYAPGVEGYTQRVRLALGDVSQRVRLTYIGEPNVAAMVAAVKALPPESLVVYTRYSPVDGARVVYPDELLGTIAEASSVPLYSGNSIYMGHGIVGGMMQTDEADGTHVGEITRRILEGTRPEDIPIAPPSLTPIFDGRQLKRWGIDEATLPKGSQILFRAATVWESYGWYIGGTSVVVALQLLLIAGLLTQRTRRRRAEETIRAREASLRTSYDRITQLAGGLINAQEAARASIAQDLHDDICQRLAMVSTSIDLLKNSSGEIQDADTQLFFAKLARDTRGTFDTVRRLSHDLHPATLRVLGLVPAVKSHCSEVAKRHNVQVSFASDGDLHDVPDDVAVCFFRIAQESLRNGVAHGAAQSFTVSLIRSADDIEMTVTDDGKGVGLDAVSRDGSGVGMITMEERARAVGGSLAIVSATDRGTTIRLRAPLTPARSDSLPDEPARTIPVLSPANI